MAARHRALLLDDGEFFNLKVFGFNAVGYPIPAGWMSLDNPAIMQVLSKKEVCKLLGIALSTLNNKIDPESRWYDPSFPKRLKVGSRTVRFSAEELTNWIQQRSQASPDRVPMQMPDVKTQCVGASPSATGLVAEAEGDDLIPAQPASKRTSISKLPTRKAELEKVEPSAEDDERSNLRGETVGAPSTSSSESGVQDSDMDALSPMSLGFLIRAAMDRSNRVVLDPMWASELRALLERIAGSGSTASQSGALSGTEVLGLLNPSEEVAAMLDEIDFHSYKSHGVLLTAVLYDAPRQCGRLVRIANTLGVHDAAPELLRLQREKLFAQYEPRASRAVGGVPTWAQFGDRSRIVRAWTNL